MYLVHLFWGALARAVHSPGTYSSALSDFIWEAFIIRGPLMAGLQYFKRELIEVC